MVTLPKVSPCPSRNFHPEKGFRAIGSNTYLCDAGCVFWKQHELQWSVLNSIRDERAKILPGDVFKWPYVCIPTNGDVKQDGNLVMGAGIAKVAVAKFPGIDREFGDHVSRYGNTPCLSANYPVFSFPTKYSWRDRSSIVLIRESAGRLVEIVSRMGLENVALPKVGCGLGGLEWDDVWAAIKPILDKRFIIVDAKT